jgi:signal transduction histidine kinase
LGNIMEGEPAAAATGWRALTGNPLRFLGSAAPWRSAAYLLTSCLVASVWWSAALALLVVPALGLLVLLSGIPLSAVERWRLRLVDPAPAPSMHSRLVRPGVWGWVNARFRETATWRELGYALLFAIGLAWVDFAVGALVACVAYLIVFPAFVHFIPQYRDDELIRWLGVDELPAALAVTAAGVLVAPVVLYLVTVYAAVRVVITRAMLVRRPGEALDAEVVELTRSRARIMEAFDAQRRRIERDLHDGAQQRLTGLIMTLGLARLELADGASAARELVDKAYGDAKDALTELRNLVHGIHPQVLTDRGLAPAVAELAERCPVPIELDIDLASRPPEPVEAAAWFIIGEAVTNIARHSRARRGEVRIRRAGHLLVLQVCDDGIGGADPERGTGLVGLADRVSVLDGRITLSSPAGGPTVLRVELPCE